MPYPKPCSCNFLKIFASQTMPWCPICPWPCEILTFPWPIQGASTHPAATSKQALPHFLHCYSSKVGKTLHQHQQICFFVFFKFWFGFFSLSGIYKNWHQFYSCCAEHSAMPLSERPPLGILQPCAASLLWACRLSGLWFTCSSVLGQQLTPWVQGTSSL